jgi:GT2 family glycosyltransferase
MLARTEDIRRAGGFDEAFAAGEDSLLAAALRAAGLDNRFCAAARGDHFNVAGLGHSLRHLVWLGRWSARVRRRVPLRGSAAARLWPLAPGLWLGKLLLTYCRVLRWGTGERLRFLALAPGIVIGLLAWNAGFLRGMIAPPRTPADDPARPAAESAGPLPISVIVCTFNRSALLERALLAFREQPRVAGAELLVIDNNSSDDTPAVVRRCAESLRPILPVRLIHEPAQGLSRARNAGIAAANGAILAFLDDDAVAEPGWLTAIAAAFADDPDLAAAGGPVVPEFETPRPAWLARELEGYYSILDLGHAPMLFPRHMSPFGANMAIRRGALGTIRFSETLGRIGTRLLSGEEGEVFARIRANGGKIAYVPAMRVRHSVGRERLRQDWLLERCHAGGISLAVAAGTPLARARLLARVLADEAYWRLRTALGAGGDPLVRAGRQAQYHGVYEAIRLPFRRPGGGSR